LSISTESGPLIGVHVWMPPKMQGVFWTASAVIGSVHVSGLAVRL
jgi:hypothetical protein